jgi:transcriptional regulator with PAS, ATPase and Fis domain
MPRRRAHAAELVKLLESAAQPLYVLDDSLTVIYLNEACRAWLGPIADDVLGQTCTYQSGDDPSAPFAAPVAAAAGLCPPPVVLDGSEVAAAVSYRAGEQTLFRHARFVPLRWKDGPVQCILALVAGHDSAQPIEQSPPPERDESQELHLQLQQFRGKKQLLYRARSVVGISPAIRRAAAQAQIAATARVSVLIVGPPGSGRRHLAEAIHYGSPAEPAGPLVPLECGLLDAELLHTTLRRAAAAAGVGGALLLCDVDRLSTEAQAAFAAAVSSPGFPWQMLATAAVPLIASPPRGQFREDLAAALSTIEIELPPLGQRRGDVPHLAQAILEEQNARGGPQLGGFAPDALDRLSAYHWPGNVAELVEVVAAAHARAAGPLVLRADLPERLHAAAEAAARPRRRDEPIQLDDFIARIERELIHRALARSKGNKAKAARLLGLNRPRLYRRMLQLGLIEKEEGE